MKLNHKYRAALFILAILCLGLPAQAQDKPDAAIPTPPIEDKRLTPIINPAIERMDINVSKVEFEKSTKQE